jgi:hypothetical protein
VNSGNHLFNVPAAQEEPSHAAADDNEPPALLHPCPCCGGRMIFIETFKPSCTRRYRPTVPIRIDTS